VGTVKDEREKAIKKYFLEQMDERTDKLRSAAIWDLHFGPCSAEYYRDAHELKDWPGYASALQELEDWADLNLVTIWVGDWSGSILTQEPEPMDDPGDYTQYDRKALKRIIFERLVTDGGMS
jgi:hypothetical protein